MSNERNIERVPPHDLQAEAAAIGAMILDPSQIDVVSEAVSVSDFYFAKFRVVVSVLFDLNREGIDKIEIVRIKNALEARGELEAAGGINGLLSLASSVPDATNAAYYASVVREKAMLRAVIDASSQAINDAYGHGAKSDDVLDTLGSTVASLEVTGKSSEAESIGAVLDRLYAELEARESGSTVGLTTGFYELDAMLCGLQPSQMIVIAARPSMGKSCLASNIAEHVAEVYSKKVLMFSLEMSKEELGKRIACGRTGIAMDAFRRRMLRADEWPRLQRAIGDVADLGLLVDDRANLSIMEVRAASRRVARKEEVGLIVIDYLQLMRADSRSSKESRQVEVSEISRGVKALAKQLNVPVIALSQLNRMAENREGHRPRLSDLRESGSIEQDADVVMLLHREAMHHVDDPEWVHNNPDKANVAELIVAKQRNGPTGVVSLVFDGPTQRFKSLI